MLAASTALVAVNANTSTCGANPARVKGCENIDHGSCGNACCVAELVLKDDTTSSTDLYSKIKGFLGAGGDDKSFTYVTGPDAAGQ